VCWQIAGYGLSAPFPAGTHGAQSGPGPLVIPPRHLKVYPVGVRLIIWPHLPGAGRPRQRPRPEHSIDGSRRYASLMPGGRTSAGAPARRESSKPALRLWRVAHGPTGPPQRIQGQGVSNICRGDEALAHRRTSPLRERKKYYLANLPRQDGPAHASPPSSRARWICEQAHPAIKRRTRPRPLRGDVPGKGLHRHGPS